MKQSLSSGRNLGNLFTASDTNRREFLKTGMSLVVVISGLEMVTGCVTTETPAGVKSEPIIHPPLPYNKIQPPMEGCLVGLAKHSLGDKLRFPTRLKEINAIAKNIREFRDLLERERIFIETDKESTIENVSYYENRLSVKPSIFVLQDRIKLYLGFPKTQSIELAKRGIVPYINACIGYHTFRGPRMDLTEIISGQYDHYIREFAQGALAFGKEYGGFFFTTMEEANGYWYEWAGKSSSYISAWRHIWYIFDELGANQYATWVWEVYCPNSAKINNPEYYYPGDKYVDWIGINAYSVANVPQANMSLYEFIHETYSQMQKYHPQKPIMLSEFARTNEYWQKRWIQDAYKSLKRDFPDIKGAIYYDNVWTLTGDHTLSPGGLVALKDLFKDPYWITAKER